ncbi:MAG: hypothetical protein WBX11_01470 [Thiobacillaceae bacterium]
MALSLENLKSRRQQSADDWDKTIVAFQSPYRLKDLCIDQSDELEKAKDKTSRQEFKLRLATNDDRRKSASVLIEKMYSWRGYETGKVVQDPYKLVLVAFQESKVVGTLTLGLDSPAGLVVDQLYKAEADQLRVDNRKLCDITRLAIDQDIKSKSVLAALFHLSFIYGHTIHRSTDFLIEVNPRHATFYQRMLGFQPFGMERMCPRVSAPAVLLRLELSYADEQIRQYGGTGAEAIGVKSIYPYFFSKKDEEGICHRLLGGAFQG